MKISSVIAACGLVLFLAGCAGGGKTSLGEEIDPQPTVAEAEQMLIQAEQQQADLLSLKEYSRATRNLNKARKSLSGDYRAAYVLDQAERASAELRQALDNSESRKPNASRILEARRSALEAGLRNSDALVEDLADVDDDLRDETDNFSKSLEPKEFSAFQKKYLSLEIRAVQFRELEAIEQAIRKAVREDADDLAPRTLRQAQLDVGEAGNMIAQSPRDPSVYRKSVDEAMASSVLLSDAMQVILEAPGTPEDVALQIVQQNRELEKLAKSKRNLEKDLEATESSLKQSEERIKAQGVELETARSSLVQSENALEKQSQALASKNRALQSSSVQVRFQNAMDEAVKQFSEDEAEVYQQGNKLIFRLKRINFASGASTLPETSKPMLAKIDEIIKAIGAETVDVLGHTDSVGSDSVNSKLSNDRAISVARYLASLRGGYKLRYKGYGESRPIASNETVEGRAINRRVDLEVTAKKISG